MTTQGDARCKAVLFCPSCGHAARPDGDWLVSDGRYVCPVCGALVTDRTPPGARMAAAPGHV